MKPCASSSLNRCSENLRECDQTAIRNVQQPSQAWCSEQAGMKAILIASQRPKPAEEACAGNFVMYAMWKCTLLHSKICPYKAETKYAVSKRPKCTNKKVVELLTRSSRMFLSLDAAVFIPAPSHLLCSSVRANLLIFIFFSNWKCSLCCTQSRNKA